MEWSQIYEKVKAVGGKTNTQPPEITPTEECIVNAIMDMAGERNYSGYIPFSSFVFWGNENGLPKHTIHYYWDVIKISEGIVKKWQSKRTT